MTYMVMRSKGRLCSDSKHDAMLYVTDDGGISWKPDTASSSERAGAPARCRTCMALKGSVWIVTDPYGSPFPSLTTIGTPANFDFVSTEDNNDPYANDGPFGRSRDPASRLDLATASAGWIVSNSQLLTTTNSQATWTQITPDASAASH